MRGNQEEPQCDVVMGGLRDQRSERQRTLTPRLQAGEPLSSRWECFKGEMMSCLSLHSLPRAGLVGEFLQTLAGLSLLGKQYQGVQPGGEGDRGRAQSQA